MAFRTEADALELYHWEQEVEAWGFYSNDAPAIEQDPYAYCDYVDTDDNGAA